PAAPPSEPPPVSSPPRRRTAPLALAAAGGDYGLDLHLAASNSDLSKKNRRAAAVQEDDLKQCKVNLEELQNQWPCQSTHGECGSGFDSERHWPHYVVSADSQGAIFKLTDIIRYLQRQTLDYQNL
uniref:Uncharacterized protein n=1 Tax=Oryza meridionalis TaxID=40149 RepID=A0A0E0C9H7_9ORYZ